MLTREEVAARLAKEMVGDWQERAIAKAVEKKIGMSAKRIWGVSDNEVGQVDVWQAQRQFKEICEGLSREKGSLALLIEAFPKLEREIHAAWDSFGTRPYQRKHDRKPFRAPGHVIAEDRRSEWFHSMIANLYGFNPDSVWLAGWQGVMQSVIHRWTTSEAAVPILIAALDGEKKHSDAVFEVLKECATGRHEVGTMSHAILQAMLGCSRPDAWEFIEKMLLAAQREEGLRQSILESVDFANPQAFRRMLRLIVDENLVRFSATVRAVNVWFGFRYDAMAAKHAESIIERVLEMLDDEAAREKALSGKDGERAYLALWCIAFEDAGAACTRGARVLADSKWPDVRFAAAHLLDVLDLPAAASPLRGAMQDSDLRVAATAFSGWAGYRAGERDLRDTVAKGLGDAKVCEELERLAARLEGKQTALRGASMPWLSRSVKASDVLMELVRETPLDRADGLVRYLEQMEPTVRRMLALSLSGRMSVYAGAGKGYEIRIVRKAISPVGRAALLELLSDAAKEVRETAADCFAGLPVEADEARKQEELLGRKATDVRTNAILRLLKQSDEAVLKSAERLLDDATSERRAAGLELAEQLIAGKRAPESVRQLVARWKEAAARITKAQEETADRILAPGKIGPAYRLEDCFGFLDDSRRIAPRADFVSGEPVRLADRGLAILLSLDDFALRHKETKLPRGPDWQSSSEEESLLLGSERLWRAPTANRRRSRAESLRIMPQEVKQLLDEWSTQFGFRQDAEEEFLFAWVQHWCANSARQGPQVHLPKPGGKTVVARMSEALSYLLNWGVVYLCSADFVSTMLEWAERASRENTPVSDSGGLAALVKRGIKMLGVSTEPAERKSGLLRDPGRGEEIRFPFHPSFASDWVEIADQLPLAWTDEHSSRFMNLVRLADDAVGPWSRRLESSRKPIDRPELNLRLFELRNLADGAKVLRPNPFDFVQAWRAGGANEQDLYRWVFLPNFHTVHYFGDEKRPPRFGFLSELVRWTRNNKQSDAGLDRAIRAAWDRVLEVEFARGDAATEVSGLAGDTGPYSDAQTTTRALAALGNERLIRGYNWGDGSKSSVFSHIIQGSRPATDDTPQRFGQLVQHYAVPEKRLIDLALYAPQWASFVEHALGWESLEDGVWWIRGHTKDTSYAIDTEVREMWDACIAERSPVSKDDFQDGAVDVEWFRRTYNALGKKRWEALYDAAKFACGGAGHKRAQLFADAMLGNVSEKDLIARIKEKRHQDSVRALGLVDLGRGAAREKRLLARYQLMQEFRRSSRKHGGSMLQASEKRAVEIGMENLARLAGYADPLRLQWAMETREIADLAEGPVVVKAGDVQVSLRINDDGAPEVASTKKGKVLASVPPAAKKVPAVKALTERATQLRRQASRMRLSLEQAMCRGDEFEAEELKTLAKHAVLWPMLSRLVLVGDGLMGYPDKNGAVLRGPDGTLEPLKGSDRLRIAHPVDFLDRTGGSAGATSRSHERFKKGWEQWQRECFGAERVQPFKQVFRELYLATESEREKTEALRYQGQQVQPRQALALFGARGWVARPEEGVFRAFHQEKVTAQTTFEEAFYTPAEIEGLTMRGLEFVKRGGREPIKLIDVPRRLFSEVMRDLDLVVSVAHRGGVDPEASQSSVEMRASLLREVCAALKLENVRVEGTRAFIRGVHCEYALHLGSANVQMLPGGSLFIVPVHSQHRGRVFLPFADDDPKCAEVISKAIALARDSEIKDPTILAQIRG